MANTFANPYSYTSPIGDAFANLAKTLMSGPTNEGSRIKVAEEALKLRGARTSSSGMADMIAKYGPDFDPRAFIAEGVRGQLDASKVADALRNVTYNAPGSSREARDRSFGGAGGAYSGTEGGFNIDQSNAMMRAANTLTETSTHNRNTEAQTAREFDEKPIESLFNGAPRFTPQSQVFNPGVAPISSETNVKGTLLTNNFNNLPDLNVEQKRVLGAESLTDSSKTGTSLQSKREAEVLDRRVALAGSYKQIDALDKMLQEPNADASVGFLGAGAGLVNGLAVQAQAAARLAGFAEPENIRSLETYLPGLQRLGIQNAKLQSAIIDLAYTIADVREGGQKSVQDVSNAIETIGGKLGDPAAMREVLAELKARKSEGYSAYEKEVKRAFGSAWNMPPATFDQGAPAPATGGEVWARGPDGQLQRAP